MRGGVDFRRIKSEYGGVLFPPDGPQPRLIGIAKLAAQGDLLAAKSRVEYFELNSRKLLNRCSSPRMPFQWTINPYRGCEFGCTYCYARYTHEFMELDGGREFEEKIYAKKVVPAALRQELAKADRRDAIAIGTATDPYQPAERRFQLTREILKVFAGQRGRRLSLTTKSDLVVRDADLLRSIGRANVVHINITITTLDERLARVMEPRAPRPELRLEAIRSLARAGLVVGVFPNPILPMLTDSEESLDAVAEAAAEAGASFFGDGILFLKPVAQEVFFPFLEQHFPYLVLRYRELFARGAFLRGEYPRLIKERVRKIRERRGLSGSPLDYRPELWDGEPQGDLFA